MKNADFWKRHIKTSASLTRIDRISEVLFGLIMVLSFTGAISAATDGKAEVKELLWGALGCNLAWGIVDAIMYLMNVYAERGRAIVSIRSLMQSKTSDEARLIFREESPTFPTVLLTDKEADTVIQRIREIPEPEYKSIFTFQDIIAAFQIFLLVFLCTFPVALPFVWKPEVASALRLSNGIALLMLFTGGYLLAIYAGFRRFITALLYMGIGLILVAITIALGG